MSEPAVLLSGPALGLVFLLGLRHGLDPDHIAAIDAITFRAARERPRLAPWIGTLFAAGHSLSVTAVVVAAALAAGRLGWPDWLAEAVEWSVIVLLILLGALNLRALRRQGEYQPASVRGRLLPARLTQSTHPVAVLLVGVVFGLVFETATQAAAWGAAASGAGGLPGALMVSAAFAAGMIATDTADSRIIAALLRSKGSPMGLRAYRRAVGMLIVVLSFGVAGYALAGKLMAQPAPTDAAFTLAGAAIAAAVAGVLWLARPRTR